MIIARPPFMVSPMLKFRPDANTVLWLPGQDDPQSATIRDRSGQGNNGTITGATWVRQSSGLWALDLDGVANIIRFGDVANVGTSDFTLLIWAKTSQAGTNKFIINKNWANPSWDLFLNSNKLRIHTNDNVGQNLTATSDTSINDGIWRLLGGNFDRDGNMTPLVDGLADGTPTDMSATATLNNTNDLSFGGQSDGAGGGANYLAGQFAMGRIYVGGLLTANEWASIFHQEKHLFGR